MYKILMIAIALALLGLQEGRCAQPNVGTTTPADTAAPTQIKWQTNYNEALQLAGQSHKPLFLFFTGSDWCGWCTKIVQEVFSSPDFIRQMGNSFVFVEVDFPMGKQVPADVAEQRANLKRKYDVTGFPTIVLLDSQGNFLAKTGYRPGGGKAFADYIEQLLAK